jgi:4-hydroxybenzoate polyprenyltransferase
MQNQRGAFMTLLRVLATNAKTVYLFVCNYNVIVLVWATIGTFCAKRSQQRSTVLSFDASHGRYPIDTSSYDVLSYASLYWANTIKSFSLSTLWMFIVALNFSISNQRQSTSVHEDKFNKPWRPLPSQRITPSQASTLLVITTTLGLLFSYVFGGLNPYLIQLAASYHYNDLGGAHGHHLIRDVLNAIGLTSWLYGCIDVAGGPTVRYSSSDAITGLTLVAAVTTTIAIQDFRDIYGDRQCGRATFPIVIGLRASFSPSQYSCGHLG